MMTSVFVETNWVVDALGPHHKRKEAARVLLDRAREGEIALYLPAICVAEARKVFLEKEAPRIKSTARELREYLKWVTPRNEIEPERIEAGFDLLNVYTGRMKRYIEQEVSGELDALKSSPGVNLFACSDEILKKMLELSFTSGGDLKPVDQAVFASVLVKGGQLLAESGQPSVFCELDSDLLPWDKKRNERKHFRAEYDQAGVFVIGDYQVPDVFPEWWLDTL